MEHTPTSDSVNRFIEELQKRIAEEKEIISNYNYINWLENFTLSTPSFTSDSWLYFPERISEEDSTNVNKLFYFHDAIEHYFNKFLIDISTNEEFCATQIHIKHNNVGYELGLVVGQGSYIYVAREEIHKDAINFFAIVNDVGPKEFEAKKGMLETLDVLITAMKQNDVPEKNILKVIEKHYK